jgi:hypothetical protein
MGPIIKSREKSKAEDSSPESCQKKYANDHSARQKEQSARVISVVLFFDLSRTKNPRKSVERKLIKALTG